MTNLIPKTFIAKVIIPVLVVALLALPIPYIISLITKGFSGLIYTTSASIVSVGLVIYLIGLNKAEREFIKIQLSSKLNKEL